MSKLVYVGFRVLGVLGLVLSLTATATLADVSDVVLTIHASSGRGDGVLEITSGQGTWVGDNFFWSTDQAIPIMSGDQVLGTFGPGQIAIDSIPRQITMGFSVQAGDVDTVVTVTSALLSFPTITDGLARADAAFTLMDFVGSGATLTGLETGGNAYITQYNGFVPGGTIFGAGIPLILVVPPATLETADYSSAPGGAYLPIGPVSNMSAEVKFTLSPYAFVSGSTNFEIIPEPAGIMLLLVGLGVLRRR